MIASKIKYIIILISIKCLAVHLSYHDYQFMSLICTSSLSTTLYYKHRIQSSIYIETTKTGASHNFPIKLVLLEF